MPSYDTIFIRALCLPMFIGILEHEQDQEQRVIIDIEIKIPANKNRDDDIGNTVRYDDIVTRVKALSQAKHYNLVETLAEDIAQDILSTPKVKQVKIAVTKPDIMDDGSVVGVEINRSKE